MLESNVFLEELKKNHDHNAKWNIIDGCFSQVAVAGSIPAVIIVAFLKHYTDRQFILNLPVFIAQFSVALFPFLLSFISGRMRRKKGAVVFIGLSQRLLWIFAVLAVLLYSDNSRQVLPLFFVGFTMYHVLSGSNSLFWQEFLGRTLHPRKLVTAMGMRSSISGLFGFGASFVVAYILSKYEFPKNFIILFSMTFICNLGCSFSHIMMKEAPYDKVDESCNGSKAKLSYFREILTLPLRDKYFLWFALFVIFSQVDIFIAGLYTSLAIERFNGLISHDTLAGVMGLIKILSGSVFSYVMGKYCDKVGKYRAYLIMLIFLILTPVFSALSNNVYIYLFVYFFNGISVPLGFILFASLISFGEVEQRHEYIASMSIIKILPAIIFTNLGGYLADVYSPELTLTLSSVLCFIGLMILIFKLKTVETTGTTTGMTVV